MFIPQTCKRKLLTESFPLQIVEAPCNAMPVYPAIRRSIVGGRTTILFSCFWCIAAVTGAVPVSSQQGGERQLWSDVEVFGSARDGIRSQSISFADLNGGSVERFPRQLDTVHEHFRAAELPKKTKEIVKKKKKPTSFDSDYDRFINEHFRQDYQGYSPESESEQMARDHENFQELPHYYRKSHPVNYAKTPSTTAVPYWPRRRQRNFKIHSNRPPPPTPGTIQEDVEDYQPNDETLAIRSYSNKPYSDDYQRIKELSEQQAKQVQKNEAHCKATKKSDMLCQVCFNPKTGAKSESCSYAPQPHSKKYAFSKENNYSSKDGDSSEEEDDGEEYEEEEQEDQNNEDESRPEIHTNPPLRKRNQSRMARGPRIKRGNGWEESKNFSTMERHSTGESKKIETYDDFFGSLSLFPEYQKYQAENVKEEEDDGEKYEFMPRARNLKAVAEDVDGEKALAEFRKRDWSDCKKARKGELTCYVCEDKHGVRHEDCMFLSSSTSSSSSTSLNPAGRSHYDAFGNGTDEKMSSADDDYSEGGVEEMGGAASGSVSVKDFPANDKDIVAELSSSSSELTAEDGVSRASNGQFSSKGVSRNKKKNVKLNRKLVIKKRKLKQHQGDYLGGAGLRQEATANGQSSPLKRRIRKKVTYRKPAKNWKQQERFQPVAVESSVISLKDQK